MLEKKEHTMDELKGKALKGCLTLGIVILVAGFSVYGLYHFIVSLF